MPQAQERVTKVAAWLWSVAEGWQAADGGARHGALVVRSLCTYRTAHTCRIQLMSGLIWEGKRFNGV